MGGLPSNGGSAQRGPPGPCHPEILLSAVVWGTRIPPVGRMFLVDLASPAFEPVEVAASGAQRTRTIGGQIDAVILLPSGRCATFSDPGRRREPAVPPRGARWGPPAPGPPLSQPSGLDLTEEPLDFLPPGSRYTHTPRAPVLRSTRGKDARAPASSRLPGEPLPTSRAGVEVPMALFGLGSSRRVK